MTESLHPAESPEFLSRLHDGELSPAEARLFEGHCVGCAACREAADEFERSLRAFRASPGVAPASDLSARILRKIRKQSPSRRPFGVMFGIDVRWAGLIAAALLIALIAPALLRREPPRVAPAPPPATPEALHAYIVEDRTAAERLPAPEARPPERRARAKEPSAPDKRNRALQQEAAGRRDADAPAAAPSSEREKAFASPGTAAPPPSQEPQPSVALKSRRAAAPSGGEAGAAAQLTESEGASPRLTVRSIDGYGEAPALVEPPSREALAGLAGREFVLLVEAGGRVREVSTSDARGSLLRKDEKPADRALAEKKEGAGLLSLRFAASDRPRRLLVRVE